MKKKRGGLGGLLLRGFKRRPLRKNRAKKGPARTSIRSLFSKAPRREAPKESVPPNPPLAHPPAPVPAATISPLIPAGPTHSALTPPALPQARPLALESGGRSLLARELLRPGEELKQSIEGFLLDQRSPHTRRAYGKDLKRFLQFLITRKSESRIDRLTLIAYKEFLLSEGLEHTTVDRHLATLRSFFRWLVDDGRIDRSPVEGVRFLNPRRLSRTIGFTDDEVRKILARPDLHTRTGAQHYAILAILFYCGLRRSEVCSLRTSSLGVERGQPVIRLTGKGNAERLIVLTPAVWKGINHFLLIARKDRAKDQYLFTPIRNNRTGALEKPLDPSMIFYIVTRYSRMAGVANRVSPHSCRATAISNARDHNVSDRAIQEFAGWASPDMITRYDKRKSAIEKSAAHSIRYGAEDREMPHWRPPEPPTKKRTDPDRTGPEEPVMEA